MRRIGRMRRKKQKKLIIVSSLSLLLFLCVGYAAFSTNLTLKAKGNIVDNSFGVDELKKKVVTSGDGLYTDPVEENRYVYKGGDPDNYVTFNGEEGGWRIIAIESDGTLKLRKIESIGRMAFDTNSRMSSNNTQYCYNDFDIGNPSFACNVWGSKTTMRDKNGNNLSSMPWKVGEEELHELPNDEASLNTYLNTTYYSSFSNEAQSLIQNHLFNVGMLKLSSAQTLEMDVNQEKEYTWLGNVGVINATDFVRASTDSSCVSVYSATEGVFPCKNDNYIYDINNNNVSPPWFTMNMRELNTGANGLWYVQYAGNLYGSGSSISGTASYVLETFPVLYIKANTTMTGSGTVGDPYVLK